MTRLLDKYGKTLVGMELGGSKIATVLLYTCGILDQLLLPVRAMVLAYSYVLTGTKVEKPYELGDI